MIISGKILKKALKSNDITQERAAIKLGVSRQTVVSWVSRAELDEDIIQDVKSKIEIDLSKYVESNAGSGDEPNHNSDMQSQTLPVYQELIRYKNKEIDDLKKEINSLRSELSRMKGVKPKSRAS